MILWLSSGKSAQPWFEYRGAKCLLLANFCRCFLGTP